MKTAVRYWVALCTSGILDTQAPQVGPSFLGVKKESPAIAQPQQGLEHGASSRNSQKFTPVPIALH